jgi:predicted alpha/beta-fold hydrolase
LTELIAGFRPPPWLANRHLQSVLPSLPLRRRPVERRAAAVVAAGRRLVLDCGEGVRLMGWLSVPVPETALAPRRLAVLLHGWEGSADSLYLLSVAQLLHDRGFFVLRLNLRDHGDTHALNRELFHSCRIAEVVGAVARVQALHPDAILSLAGFSLGGNFWLRVGARASAAGIRIARIVAVCPVLDPATTLAALESGPAIYRWYFLRKWRRSLLAKQAAWPSVYDFGALLADPSLTEMTDRMVRQYTDFPNLAAYLRGYAITGPVLESLATPATLITSRDDPMILARDLDKLARPKSLRLVLTERGGHCGFMDSFGGPSWIDRAIAAELERDR